MTPFGLVVMDQSQAGMKPDKLCYNGVINVDCLNWKMMDLVEMMVFRDRRDFSSTVVIFLLLFLSQKQLEIKSVYVIGLLCFLLV